MSKSGRWGTLPGQELTSLAQGWGFREVGTWGGRASWDRRLTLGVWLSGTGASEKQEEARGSASDLHRPEATKAQEGHGQEGVQSV